MATETRRTDITWNLSNGAPATVTVEMFRQVRHLGTNDMTGAAVTRDEGWEIRTTATAAGTAHNGLGYITPVNNPVYAAKGYTHQIGKLAIPAAKAEEVLAAVAAYKATPEWVAQVAAQRANDAAGEAHEAHVRRIERTA